MEDSQSEFESVLVFGVIEGYGKQAGKWSCGSLILLNNGVSLWVPRSYFLHSNVHSWNPGSKEDSLCLCWIFERASPNLLSFCCLQYFNCISNSFWRCICFHQDFVQCSPNPTNVLQYNSPSPLHLEDVQNPWIISPVRATLPSLSSYFLRNLPATLEFHFGWLFPLTEVGIISILGIWVWMCEWLHLSNEADWVQLGPQCWGRWSGEKVLTLVHFSLWWICKILQDYIPVARDKPVLRVIWVMSFQIQSIQSISHLTFFSHLNNFGSHWGGKWSRHFLQCYP